MDRMIKIRCKNATYSQVVKKGTPQGSVLSPFLCNLVIDSGIRCNFPEGVEILAFADDIVLFTKGKDLTRMTKDMQSAYDILSGRCNSMLLELTTAKPEIAISLRGQLLPTKDTVRYLGLELNSKLTWIVHIKSKCQKAKQMIMQIKR